MKLLTRVFAWKLDLHGIQVYDAPDHAGKWMETSTQCPVCHARFEVVVPLHQMGAECPFCGHVDFEYIWNEDE